jgi:AbrB family looped-hinge helix DNA binding protein
MARARASVRGERAMITSKGQVTIPKAIREQLGLKAGTKLHF